MVFINAEKGVVIFFPIVLVALILLFNAFGTIKAGERGVLLQFGAVQEKIFNEGLYIKVPFIQKMVGLDVKTDKMETEGIAYSNDLQTINAKIALNYHLNPNSVNKLYQEIGRDFESRIIAPSIQETIKAVIANYKAQNLIEKREIVKEEIKQFLRDRLDRSYIIVDDFSIVNFDFSTEYEKAIEAKQVAQQDALKAENILAKTKIEAESRIAEAEGKARAIQIEGDALRSSPQIAELRWIEKWNGQVPQYWGNATPFIGIK
ncbi:hypothetical protein BWK69_00685 [Candidatus Parcubacteria bacterium A4]|nr:MAG: hypothetical protein BWK69_00685 [Candidatus Parcubacteria bacterium A4]